MSKRTNKIEEDNGKMTADKMLAELGYEKMIQSPVRAYYIKKFSDPSIRAQYLEILNHGHSPIKTMAPEGISDEPKIIAKKYTRNEHDERQAVYITADELKAIMCKTEEMK